MLKLSDGKYQQTRKCSGEQKWEGLLGGCQNLGWHVNGQISFCRQVGNWVVGPEYYGVPALHARKDNRPMKLFRGHPRPLVPLARKVAKVNTGV